MIGRGFPARGSSARALLGSQSVSPTLERRVSPTAFTDSHHISFLAPRSTEMATDLLKIVSGMGDEEVVGQDRYYSRIKEIAAQVELK